MKRVVVVAAVGAAACGPPAPAAMPVASAPTPTRAAEARRPALHCRQPEMWLALYPRAEIPAHFCATCPDRCKPHYEAPDTPVMRWGLLDGDLTRFGCDDLAYARSLILAYHDVAIPDEPWRSYFAAQPWYRAARPRDAVPAAARDNAAWLGAALAACAKRHDEWVVRDYKPAIVRWFQRRTAGDVDLPGRLFVDMQPATRARFLEFLDHGDPGAYFTYDLRTPIRLDDPAYWREHFPGRTIVVLRVGTSAPTLSCIDGAQGIDCEGYEGIVFVFDATTRELVGLHVSAAG